MTTWPLLWLTLSPISIRADSLLKPGRGYVERELLACKKEPAGVPPIAIGEVLRRLAAKCLIQRCQDEVIERLLPLQMGVGILKAAEIISHAVQAWSESARSDESLILVDFENAFNTLDRKKMLEAIAILALRQLLLWRRDSAAGKKLPVVVS